MSGLANPDFWFGALTIAAIYSIFTLGLQLNIGFTGVLNMGQSGFMGVGAYTMVILVVQAGWSLWLAALVALGSAALFAVLLSWPALRLPEEYFAMVMLAAASIVVIAGQNLVDFTGGNNGLSGFDNDWVAIRETMMSWLARIGLGDQFVVPLMVVAWIVFFAMAITLKWLQSTPWGRVLRAVRDDEDAAGALGKNVRLYKLQSVGIAAVCAAVAGALMALNISVVYPNSFSLDVMFTGAAILMLCGLGNYLGIAYGSLLLWVVLESARFVDLPLSSDRVAAIRLLIVGLVLIIVTIFRPQGLFGSKQEMTLRD